MNTAIVILAAGNSSRLGIPKQLLQFEGKSLLNRTIETCLLTAMPVMVVLGAYQKEIKKSSLSRKANFVVNPNWKKGMSSSISLGLKNMLKTWPDTHQVIFTVADQVHLSTEIIKELIKTQELTKKNIVTCSYSKTTGTPTLFNQKYFEQLISLEGNSGAKEIVKKNTDDVATISFERGEIDIDTIDDYNKLIDDSRYLRKNS